MPLKFTRKISDNVSVGIWQIEESIEWLLLATGNNGTEDFLQKIQPLRKLQRLCARLLLGELVGRPVLLSYDTYGNPCLLGSEEEISVSHTGNYVAAIVNKNEPTGIDIEEIR